mmetsp:Transcript_14464/g.29571  ORF Transcript_14464/g.29571 Transcript_14464/m.29571 type:complete len:297 (-) Transcript_14464:1261-2151(-)
MDVATMSLVYESPKGVRIQKSGIRVRRTEDGSTWTMIRRRVVGGGGGGEETWSELNDRAGESSEWHLSRPRSLPEKRNLALPGDFENGWPQTRCRELELPGYLDHQKVEGSREETDHRGARRAEMTTVWLQLSFNAVVLVVLSYMLVSCAMAIRGDIRRQIEKEVALIELEKGACENDFHLNRCHDDERVVPKMRSFCAEWDNCRRQNAEQVAMRTKVTAEMLAEIINVFLEKISWKALLFAVASGLAMLIASNILFFRTRDSVERCRTSGCDDVSRQRSEREDPLTASRGSRKIC